MLDLILLHTNEKIQEELDERRQRDGSSDFLKKNPHLKIVDKVKMLCLICDIFLAKFLILKIIIFFKKGFQSRFK
jgi:hypothetical protein